MSIENAKEQLESVSLNLGSIRSMLMFIADHIEESDGNIRFRQDITQEAFHGVMSLAESSREMLNNVIPQIYKLDTPDNNKQQVS